MTTPKEALELKDCPFCNGSDARSCDTYDRGFLRRFVFCHGCGARSPYFNAEDEALKWWNTRATASLEGDAVERVARTICQSGKFETGQGTCAVICMDQLGDARKKGCGHCTRVHGVMARAILATLEGNN